MTPDREFVRWLREYDPSYRVIWADHVYWPAWNFRERLHCWGIYKILPYPDSKYCGAYRGQSVELVQLIRNEEKCFLPLDNRAKRLIFEADSRRLGMHGHIDLGESRVNAYKRDQLRNYSLECRGWAKEELRPALLKDLNNTPMPTPTSSMVDKKTAHFDLGGSS